MYAIIQNGSNQLKVEVNQKIWTEKLPVEVGQTYQFNQVLLIVDQEKRLIGQPYLKNAKVEAKVEKQGLSPKLHIYKYKAKTNSRKLLGHRQKYTRLVITGIFHD